MFSIGLGKKNQVGYGFQWIVNFVGDGGRHPAGRSEHFRLLERRFLRCAVP